MYFLKLREEGESVSLFRKQIILISLCIYGFMFLSSIFIIIYNSKYIETMRITKINNSSVNIITNTTIDSFG